MVHLRVAVLIAVLPVFTCLLTDGIAAQEDAGTLVVEVRHGQSEDAVVNAEVAFATRDLRGLTGKQGRAVFRRLSPGEYELTVRHLAFRERSLPVVIEAGGTTTVSVRLEPRALELPGIDVQVEGEESWIDEFLRRHDNREGHFITHADLEARDPVRLTDMLRSIPKIRVAYRTDIGWTTSMMNRSLGRDFSPAEPGRLEGHGPARCTPYLVVDGDKRNEKLWRLNHIDPDDVIAMEVYWKPSEIPDRYRDDLDPCGAILIWTEIALEGR